MLNPLAYLPAELKETVKIIRDNAFYDPRADAEDPDPDNRQTAFRNP